MINWLRGVPYLIRTLLFPFNVIKVRALPRTWVDRDVVMFHAMFQILVDFVELEQPFRSWTAPNIKRHTDRAEMRAYVERVVSPEELKSLQAEGNPPEWNAHQVAQAYKQYRIYREILFTYEWYKDGKWEWDDKFSELFHLTAERLEFADNGILHVSTGEPKYITFGELHEAELEHRLKCDIMLTRLLSIRRYLWS